MPRTIRIAVLVLGSCVLNIATAADVAVSPAGRLAASPDVAIASDGRLYVAWIDRGAAAADAPAGPPSAAHGGAAAPASHGGGAPRSHASNVDVLVASSTDGGRSFSAPVRANDRAGQVWSFPTSRPRIAVGPRGTLHVLYTGNDVNAAGQPVIVPMYTRSTDGGRTFAPARRLVSPPDGDLSHVIHGGYAQAETFGTLVVDAGGGVHVYWIDTRFMRGDGDTGALLALHSSDDGRTFGAEQVLAKTGACPCCQLTAAAAGAKRVYLGMRIADAGFRDSTVLASDDGGRTFGAPVRLGDTRWKIDGCPLKPTVVAVDGTQVYAAAFNAATESSGVRFAASSDGGRTFGAFRPLHPDAAVSDAPAVVALPNSRVQVFWHAKAPGDAVRAVYGASSSDGGATFTPPERLSSGGSAGYPAAAALRTGDVALAYVADDRVLLRTPAAREGAIRPVSVAEFRAALEAERGHAVVLNLWASWCAPCLKEIPALLEVERRFAGCGVRLVGLATDDPAEVGGAVRATHSKYFPSFGTYARTEGEPDSYASVVDPAWNELMPTTYVIDGTGAVRARLQGGRTAEQFAQAIAPLARCTPAT